MSKFLAILSTLALIAACITNAILWYQFKSGCKDYLKLAGDAPNIERSARFLGQAIDYMEGKGLTSGNSAYFFRTPRNDVGIWYEQIKGAHKTVDELIKQELANPGSVPQLTKDNALMKVREVVLDEGEDGTIVTTPQNITVFPNQLLFLFWYLISIIGTVLSWLYVTTKD